MANSIALWRQNLQPASFRGASFKVEVDTVAGGRRQVPHEYPKKDTPNTEDMGRRVRRYRVAAYIVSGPSEPDYQSTRDQLIAALEALGPGQLVHPTLGIDQVVVDTYIVIERRDRGGYTEIDIEFYEYGSPIAFSQGVSSTADGVASAADDAKSGAQQSTDIAVLPTEQQGPLLGTQSFGGVQGLPGGPSGAAVAPPVKSGGTIPLVT